MTSFLLLFWLAMLNVLCVKCGAVLNAHGVREGEMSWINELARDGKGKMIGSR